MESRRAPLWGLADRLRGFIRTWPELLSCKIAKPDNKHFCSLFFGCHNRLQIGPGTYFAPGRARTCNHMIRSHTVQRGWRPPTGDTRIPDSGTLENFWTSVLSLKKPSTRISNRFEKRGPSALFQRGFKKFDRRLGVPRGNSCSTQSGLQIPSALPNFIDHLCQEPGPTSTGTQSG